MSLSKQVAWVILAVLVLTGIGYPLTVRLWGTETLPALFWAAAGCLVACVASLCPLAIVTRMCLPDALPQAALAGMVLRILLTGAFLFTMTTIGAVPYWPFATWLMVFYLSLLVLETIIALSYVKNFKGFNASGGQHPA